MYRLKPPRSPACAQHCEAGAGGLSTAFLKIVRREEKVGTPPYCTHLAWSVRSVFPDNFLGRMESRRGDQLGAGPLHVGRCCANTRRRFGAPAEGRR